MVNTSIYIKHFKSALLAIYANDEADAITRLIFENHFQESYTQLRFNDREVSDEDLLKLNEILNRLLQSEPVQYVLGYSFFKGFKYIVNQSTLIPRPETELLVDLVVSEGATSFIKPTILEIGTGSGCIAISIKSALPQATIFATDISQAALFTAKQNAIYNEVQVNFVHHDILGNTPIQEYQVFDIIVSNPPYILLEEQQQMHQNVKLFEPKQALYVTDNNPMQFYEAILHLAQNQLSNGGLIAFEINQAYGKQTAALLEKYGYHQISILKDQFGNDRMVKATK